MVALGVDLSTDPRKTWVCQISAFAEGAEVLSLEGGHDDEGLLARMGEADIVGIDCPLGWPDPFVAALAAHSTTGPWPGRSGAGGPDAYRRTLMLRATDIAIKKATGINPLSVSANLLGATAMRCALLQDALLAAGLEVDRTGRSGLIVEVYPRAALQAWGLQGTGYKGLANSDQCGQLADGLLGLIEGLTIGPDLVAHLRRNDDALDAFVSALVALDVRRSGPSPIPEPLLEQAAREGWIHVPSGRALRLA